MITFDYLVREEKENNLNWLEWIIVGLFIFLLMVNLCGLFFEDL